MKKNKFKILIASYNNEEWVEYNLASILNQTYDNYEVIYVDDCSKDNTFEKVKEIVGDNRKFTLIKNETNLGGTYNHIRFFDSVEDDEIILLIDGDDWFFDDNVFEKLNQFYNDKDVWMTYGKFYAWDGENATEAYPQNSPFPDFVHDHKLYRLDTWRSSHLRTYKGFLIKSVDRQDFISKIDNKLFWHAADLALAFPCLEMCPKEKIGVLDFPSYVYNASKTSHDRTIQRETADNAKYEIEIRNKKKYKECGFGEKLPQVNVFGDNAERHNIPTKFSYTYFQNIGEFDIVFLQDDTIVDFINGKFGPFSDSISIVARVCENKNFFNQKLVIDYIKKYYNKFNLILTWSEEILKLPNAKFCPLTDLSQFNTLPIELSIDELMIFQKSKNISCVASTKSFFPGHIKRLEIINQTKHRYDLYGRGFKEISSKLEALKDYRYSIAIENEITNNYFTEKINDCFLTGTIPIYYGCPNISSFYNEKGIIIFNSVEELNEIIDNISEEDYNSRIDAIKENYEKAKKMPLTSDMIFDIYYKDLIMK
tara:strand:- start:12557 stop:14173 length:1617 start_codon:yes stop_codon:yes gene_type:complete